ncbi:MAG: patatin-like phospholipase family protein [Candidatus Gracilibacteria bacterium]|nr:patatin-like phospholipase family protein [Candidatus Peregrinibacteria bacterium]
MSQDRTTGLTLGGGGAKAFGSFAIVEELLGFGVSFDAVSGASAGAIIGAYFALFGEVESLRKELGSFGKIDWLKFADFTIGNRESLIKGQRYKEYLQEKFEDATFEDTKIPLFVAVTDLVTGKIDYMRKGKIVDALLASSAYPGVFPPFQKGNKVLVDGGVLDNLPYEVLFEHKIDRVVAVNLSVAGGDKSELNSSIAIVSRSLELMMDNAFHRIYEEDERLFVFDLEFKSRFMSLWNITDLSKSYDFGKKQFQKRKNELLEWYGG